ncbi:MAG: HDOD domain-containing protein [Deltaproteobacteria bacterium]|nr:HDOD domain-containing protein [Deltaproteobacteria bacterium]
MEDTAASENVTYTADQFLEKLTTALSKDGDFPASARIVNELRALITNPKTTANQVAEVILKEPSLGIRVLHLVNSTFYRRAKPIMTVSQAVIQVGMRPLAELCAGLVLLQKFVPAARSGGPFASCLQKMLLSSLVSSTLNAEVTRDDAAGKNSESGYLAGSFAEIGTLLLAYYFPPIYENALKRAQSKRQDIDTSIYEIVGMTTTDLSQAVIKALNLPEFYTEILQGSQDLEKPAKIKKALPNEQSEIAKLATSVHAAKKISSVLVFSKDKAELDKVISTLGTRLNLDNKTVGKVLGDLPKIFQSHCLEIDLHLPPLPEFVSSYSSEVPIVSAAAKSDDNEDFSKFVEEIREAVENGEPTASVITTVMETLSWGLKFDRVLLMLVAPGRKKLIGRMMLGSSGQMDAQKIERSLGNDLGPYAPDVRAFKEGHPVFQGDSLFKDGWPLAATPIGFGQRCIGIIYSDRVSSQSTELSGREQAAIGVLAELLDRSVSLNK